VLRPALLVIGLAALVGAVAAALAGAPFPLILWLSLLGVMLVGGILFERGRYKPAERARPGPDWVATDETFVDPVSGDTVTVFYRPSTGERRYVGR
jgi:hypothetical protein